LRLSKAENDTADRPLKSGGATRGCTTSYDLDIPQCKKTRCMMLVAIIRDDSVHGTTTSTLSAAEQRRLAYRNNGVTTLSVTTVMSLAHWQDDDHVDGLPSAR